MRHTEQEGAGGREEEVMLAVELATKAYHIMIIWILCSGCVYSGAQIHLTTGN